MNKPAGQDDEVELKAGVAEVNITPPIGIRQVGFEEREGRPSIGIHDELYAKALVLKSGRERTVIVSTDTVGLDAKLTSRIKGLIHRQTGIKDVLLCASHTHCGPLIGPVWHMPNAGKDYRYIDSFCRKIVGAVCIASRNMAAVRIKSGVGCVKIGVNRRPIDRDGKVRIIGANPRGPIDTDVPILVLEEENGKTMALLLTYACHAISAYASFYISADYPGYTQRLIENKLGGLTFFTQGAGADINPAGFPSKCSFALAQTQGEKLGRTVLSTLRKIEKYERHPRLMVRSGKIDIPLRKEVLSEKTAALRDLKKENLMRIKGRKFSYEIYVMRLGKCLFVGLEGEPLVEIGLEIKQKILKRYRKIKQAFIIGYAGNTSYYLTLPKTFEEGGYELQETILDKEASSMVVNSVLKMVDHVERGRN